MFKKNETENIVMFICFMLVVLYSIYEYVSRSNYLNNNYAYTVGQTMNYEFADGNKDCIKYGFFVDDIKYFSCVTIDPKICCPLNKFYRVKYSKIKPQVCEMDLSREVRDSVEIINAGFRYRK